MNKKTYKQPMTMIVKIQQRHIICASDGMSKLHEEKVETGWSRGGSIWDNN